MKLDIQSIHFDADIRLKDFIQKKVDKLETFYDGIIDSEVFLKVESTTEKENKSVEIKVKVSNSMLFSKEQAKTFEEATDMAVEALRKQITRYKEKRIAG